MSEILYPSNPILIVDDEYYILLNLSGILKSNGMNNIITCQDSRDVMNIFTGTEIDVLLLDLTMPHVSGQDLLVQIREQYPEVPIIVITGTSDVSIAVSCMKLGVFDYLVKSIEESKLIATVSRAIENQELRRENISLRNHLVRQDLEHVDELSEIVFQAFLIVLLSYNFLIPGLIAILQHGGPASSIFLFLGVIVIVLVSRWIVFLYWRLLARRWLRFYQGFMEWGEELERVFSSSTKDNSGGST